MPGSLESLPEPPYYAVVFTSLRSSSDPEEYARVAERMVALAATQSGYLGMTSLRNAAGLGVTISYWTDRVSITDWRTNAEHRDAQEQGRETFYDEYRIEVCRVERNTVFPGEPAGEASTA